MQESWRPQDRHSSRNVTYRLDRMRKNKCLQLLRGSRRIVWCMSSCALTDTYSFLSIVRDRADKAVIRGEGGFQSACTDLIDCCRCGEAVEKDPLALLGPKRLSIMFCDDCVPPICWLCCIISAICSSLRFLLGLGAY